MGQPSLRQYTNSMQIQSHETSSYCFLKFRLTLKVYKKEKNRFFALMKNTFFSISPSYKEDFFF